MIIFPTTKTNLLPGGRISLHDSATPYVAEFDNTDAGKTVWYIMRWKNTRGETGPWSFPLSAKVPA